MLLKCHAKQNKKKERKDGQLRLFAFFHFSFTYFA